jgi:hypothetical protein
MFLGMERLLDVSSSPGISMVLARSLAWAFSSNSSDIAWNQADNSGQGLCAFDIHDSIFVSNV